MTAHSQETAEAADVRLPETGGDDAATPEEFFEAMFAQEGEEAAETPDDEASDELADEDGDYEDGEDEGEPEGPAIDAPADLTAEEKDRFAQLSDPEAQRLIADISSRRNTQVQQAQTKAAEAQRAAEKRAADAEAEAKADYAERFAAFAGAFAPRPPDPALAQADPAAYIAHKAQYDAAIAQHNQLAQQIEAMASEANYYFEQQKQAWQQEQIAELMKVPEIADPAKRGPYFEQVNAVREILGYDPKIMEEASAVDILALKKAAEWKEGYDQWKAHQSRKMQRVRAAKSSKPNAPGAAPRSVEATKAETAFRNNPGDMRAAAAVFADYL